PDDPRNPTTERPNDRDQTRQTPLKPPLSLLPQVAYRGDRLGFLKNGASHRPRHRDFMKTESITVYGADAG
ncbi:hypothetical protein, partial [Micromonospora inaquosa]